jgi:hypothetical protein
MYRAREAPLRSRALEILTALCECRDELGSKQGSMARRLNVVAEPANNLKVHMSALRDGRDGHWFIVDVPGLERT